MRISLALTLAVLWSAVLPANAQVGNQVTNAEAAATAWLALNDHGDFAASWAQAAPVFQTSISQTNWMNALSNARIPLGSLTARKVASARYSRSLPGAPDGEYVVIRYQSDFEHKMGAVETVTPMLQPDGSWKVAGYFIR
jgi:hypothetical protein